jgi:hypothetical protein
MAQQSETTPAQHTCPLHGEHSQLSRADAEMEPARSLAKNSDEVSIKMEEDPVAAASIKEEG